MEVDAAAPGEAERAPGGAAATVAAPAPSAPRPASAEAAGRAEQVPLATASKRTSLRAHARRPPGACVSRAQLMRLSAGPVFPYCACRRSSSTKQWDIVRANLIPPAAGSAGGRGGWEDGRGGGVRHPGAGADACAACRPGRRAGDRRGHGRCGPFMAVLPAGQGVGLGSGLRCQQDRRSKRMPGRSTCGQLVQAGRPGAVAWSFLGARCAVPPPRVHAVLCRRSQQRPPDQRREWRCWVAVCFVSVSLA